ncbi:hypothetical protein CRUP_009726 [Coryphaenoides rupestris]|nr:hypothetical protein CRUP_009726 [Coryphaenoides rupestris]
MVVVVVVVVTGVGVGAGRSGFLGLSQYFSRSWRSQPAARQQWSTMPLLRGRKPSGPVSKLFLLYSIAMLTDLQCLDPDVSGIVRWMGHFNYGPHICLEFELLNSSLTDLAQQAEHHKLPLMQIRDILKQLATSLEFLGVLKIIHADLKPEKIMVTRQGRLKLIDFGSSMYVSKAKSGDIFQTIWYRTPEIMLGLLFTGARNVQIPSSFTDLLKRMLQLDPDKHITSSELQEHPVMSLESEDQPNTSQVLLSPIVDHPNRCSGESSVDHPNSCSGESSVDHPNSCSGESSVDHPNSCSCESSVDHLNRVPVTRTPIVSKPQKKATVELPEIHERPGVSWSQRGVPGENPHVPRELLATLGSPVDGRPPCKERCGMRNSQPPFSRRHSQQNGQGSGRGAGRDTLFTGDTPAAQKKRRSLPPMVGQMKDGSIAESLIPEEYHVVKQQGVLDFLGESATEVEMILPTETVSLTVSSAMTMTTMRPSGRWEVVQLMQVMEEMMEKAAIHQQTEELTDLSQVGALLELVKVEQNIYSVVFHELIRQVSVHCAERGLLLDRIRQQYACLLKKVSRHMERLHTASLAERDLNHRLTQEGGLLSRPAIQHLNTYARLRELSEIRTHDEMVSQQAESAQQELAEALDQASEECWDFSRSTMSYTACRGDVLQSQMDTLAGERDLWRKDTFRLAAKASEIVTTVALQCTCD